MNVWRQILLCYRDEAGMVVNDKTDSDDSFWNDDLEEDEEERENHAGHRVPMEIKQEESDIEQVKKWWDQSMALMENPEKYCHEARQLVKDLLVAKSQEKNPDNMRRLQELISEGEGKWRMMIEAKRRHEEYVTMTGKNILKCTRPEDREEMIKYIHRTGG